MEIEVRPALSTGLGSARSVCPPARYPYPVAEYDESTYGERIADTYDSRPVVLAQETEPAVAFLAELAGPGPVLELGIGTGRVALPLARRGLGVHGIDSSPQMVAQLKAKPGGPDIPVTMGNFADVAVDGKFNLIFVVFNTLFALLSQEDQVRCFAGVARHLDRGGVFVIEAFFPDVARFDRGQRVSAMRVDIDGAYLDAATYNPVEQRISSQHIVLTGAGINLYPVQLRYAWPSELDLMARLAGLRLRERWGGWKREPFTVGSQKHVSVYEAGS